MKLARTWCRFGENASSRALGMALFDLLQGKATDSMKHSDFPSNFVVVFFLFFINQPVQGSSMSSVSCLFSRRLEVGEQAVEHVGAGE